MHDFKSIWDARSQLIPQVIRLRREQLGLSHEEVAARAQRRALRPAKLRSIEEGETWLSPTEGAYLEQALYLPPDFLGETLLQRLRDSVDPHAIDAHDALLHLTSESLIADSGAVCLVGCAMCFRTIRTLVARYSLQVSVVRNLKGECICERAEGGGSGTDTALLFRIAVRLSQAQRIIILGGGQDVADVAARIRFADIRVIRGGPSAGTVPIIPDATGFVIVARGEISHSASAPYLQAIGRRAKGDRPTLLYPQSSNLVAIAEELLRNSVDDG